MTDWMEELERLGELREKGQLSDEEFEAKKSELLSSEQGAAVQQVETILKWAPIKQKYVKGFKRAFIVYIIFFLVVMVGIAQFMIRNL